MRLRDSFALALLSTASIIPMARAQTAPSLPPEQGTVLQNPAGQLKQIFNRDGGYSIGIGQSSEWFFRDTFLSPPNQNGKAFIHNSFSATKLLDPTKDNGINFEKNLVDGGGSPVRVIPLTAAEQLWNKKYTPSNDPYGHGVDIWPGQPAYDPDSGTIIVPFSESLYSSSGNPYVGSGFAIGTIGSNGFPNLKRPVQSPVLSDPAANPGAPTLMWCQKCSAFGTTDSFVYQGYFYALGGNAPSATIARVLVTNVTNPSAWTFFDGSDWANDSSKAVPFIPTGVDGQTVFFDNYLNEWVDVYIDLNGYLWYSVASTLTGKWATPGQVLPPYSPMVGVNNAQGKPIPDYEGHCHPEFSPDNGKTIYCTAEEFTDVSGYVAKTAMPIVQIVFQ